MLTIFISVLGVSILVALYIYVPRELERKACLATKTFAGQNFDIKPEQDELRILLLGDTGSGNEEQRQIAEASAKTCQEQGCDLVLLLGDNFIQEGVSGLDDPQFDNKFESIYSHDLPFYAVLGNHDLRGDWRAQIDYTKMNQRWMMPDVNYTFTGGPVLFKAINTTCTICSLATIFGKNPKPWKIVFGHRPLVTSGRHRGMIALERWLIRKAKPDFMFSGHNHILEHLTYEGIDQIVSGGGGNPIHPIREKNHPLRKYFLQDLGYVWVHFTSSEAKVHFYDKLGQEVYCFTRNKN